MAVELEDSASGVTLPLWNARELRRETDAAVDTFTAMGFDADEAFLTSLEQSESVSLSGEVTAGRLVQDSRFSSNRREALGEWAATFEAFVNGGQGDGYTLSRSYAGDSFSGVVETASWTARGGEPDSLGWNLSFIRGASAGTEGTVSLSSVNPGGNWEIDGYTIDYPGEFQAETSQSFEIYRRALADNAGDNDLFPKSGATRRITIMADVVGSETTRKTFYDNITAKLGKNETVTVRDALTGRTHSGVIGSFDTTDESGRVRLGEFSIEIVQGDVQ